MDSDTPEVKNVSRRGLVKGAAGAAAVGAATVAAVRISGATDHTATTAGHDAAGAAAAIPNTGSLPKEDWVIYVRDADNGALDVFVGMQHFTVRDSELVARLVASAK